MDKEFKKLMKVINNKIDESGIDLNNPNKEQLVDDILNVLFDDEKESE